MKKNIINNEDNDFLRYCVVLLFLVFVFFSGYFWDKPWENCFSTGYVKVISQEQLMEDYTTNLK